MPCLPVDAGRLVQTGRITRARRHHVGSRLRSNAGPGSRSTEPIEREHRERQGAAVRAGCFGAPAHRAESSCNNILSVSDGGTRKASFFSKIIHPSIHPSAAWLAPPRRILTFAHRGSKLGRSGLWIITLFDRGKVYMKSLYEQAVAMVLAQCATDTFGVGSRGARGWLPSERVR